MTKITGFDQLVKSLNAASKDVQDEVKGITGFYLTEIELEAIREAPGPGQSIAAEHGPESQVDIARNRGWTPISQAIGKTIDPSGYKGSVFVESSAGAIAAWVEFGTGQSAKSYLMTVPAEWRALAQKYYINGKGSILAKPYLLPAFLKYQILYVNELKQVLKNIKL